MIIEKLSEKHFRVVQSFSCVEHDDFVASLNSKQRRRIRQHSREMDSFLHDEALSEQERGTNTTHLLLNDDADGLIAYVSHCADAIPLEVQEREEKKMSYSTSPALEDSPSCCSL